ncbi:MAG: putative protein-tyrosine phosphatase [Frankiales bacterium]|nr:putative protein-tyrosine phosphatase [Frankiales bacterium]
MTLALAAAFNVRDMGGLTTTDGGRIRTGHLWRADSLHRLGADDLEILAGLGLRTVVDLRSLDEVERNGQLALAHASLELHSVPVFTDIRDLAMPEIADDSTEAGAAAMVELYLQMLELGGAGIARAIETLGAEGALPGLFHCAAGKDRTGLVAAFILESVGVDDDSIAGDYGRTQAAEHKTRAFMAEHDPQYETRLDQYPAWLRTSHPETMLATLSRVRELHGSIRGLLVELGVQESTLTRLRQTLVEPV